MADDSLSRSGIYQILNTVNGKRYVGSAVTLAARWRQHRCELGKGRHNPHLQNAWRKYGEAAFEFSVIEYVTDKQQLVAREQHHIDALKPEYNADPIAGSRLGSKNSEEAKLRIGRASALVWAQPGYRERMSALHKGKTLPDEQKAKIGAAHRGKKLSPAHAAVVAKNNTSRNKSEEHRARMSSYWKGRPKTREQLDKMAATKRGRPLSPEHRAKLADTMRAAHAEGRHSYERTEYVRHATGRTLAKLTDDQAREIRAKRRAGHKCLALAAEYGVSQSAISNICAGTTYGWIKD